MKKLFSSLLMVLMITMMASGAWAASVIDIADTAAVNVDTDVAGTSTGAYVVGSEWMAGQGSSVVSVNLGSAVPTPGGVAADRSNILYKPAIAMGIGNTIIITITNGALAPSTSYGLWDLTVPGHCADLIDFTADSAGNYTRLVLKFVETGAGPDNPSVQPDAVLALTSDGAIPSVVNKPILRFTNVQLTAGDMIVQVPEAYDGTAQPLVAPRTTTEIVVMKRDQLSAKVQYATGTGMYADGNATSVIDMESTPSRTKFVAEALQDTPTPTTSTFAILAVTQIVNQGINLATATYTITLSGDQTAIVSTTGVQLEGTNFIRGTNQWSIDSTFAAHDLRTATANDVVITVNGTTIINPATFGVTVAIDPVEGGVATKTVLDNATADIWRVTGAMQCRIPYMIIDTGNTLGYSSFLEITNRGSLPAQVSIDAIISNSDATTNITESRNAVLTVPANSVYIVRQSDLDTWFVGIDNTKLYRVALTLTVVAPQNTVDVTAYHLNPGGDRTSTAVLYNTNNANDGRLWQ